MICFSRFCFALLAWLHNQAQQKNSFESWKEITLGEQICDRHNEIEERTDHLFLEQLLNTLEAKEQQLIYLRYVEEKTQSEVAKIMGTTQVQISRREKKLLAKLRERA